MSLRSLYYSLPPRWRFWVRRCWYFPRDIWNEVARPDNATPIPPRGLIYTGSGDFLKDGRKLVADFQQLACLKPHHCVLDVGSGIGRVALPLTQFLNEQGRYYGFDVVSQGVAWCQKNISSRYPNFHFEYVSLKNDLYTATGSDASLFTFPYPDNFFDFCCVISVFTHLQQAEVARYVREIQRTLIPGGTVFATFFLFNDTHRLTQNRHFSFPYISDHYALMDKRVRSGNIAFSEHWLEKQIQVGFEVLSKHYGYWDGSPSAGCLNFQDVLVLKKKIVAIKKG